MTIDLKPLLEAGKKGLRVKSELDRVKESYRRIYEISRMLPEEEGFELVNIHQQTIIDAKKIQKVILEK